MTQLAWPMISVAQSCLLNFRLPIFGFSEVPKGQTASEFTELLRLCDQTVTTCTSLLLVAECCTEGKTKDEPSTADLGTFGVDRTPNGTLKMETRIQIMRPPGGSMI